MSNLKAEVTAPFGDGEHTFRLTVPCLIELEQKCDAPFTVILHRLSSGTYKIEDVRQTVRLALIGGGMKPTEAQILVRRYVDETPPIEEGLKVARLALMGVLFGFEAAPLETGTAAEGKVQAAPEASPSASTPPPSTATPPSSQGSRLRPLVNSRFGSTRQQ